MSSVLSLDTSAEEDISHAIKGGLLDFEDTLGEGDQDGIGYDEYIRVLTAGKDLSSPVKLSSNKDIQARLIGRNAFIISTPRKLFSFSRKEVYQHYWGSIYRKAHTSPSKPRRSTFEPLHAPHLSQARGTPGDSQRAGPSSPDARRMRSRTVESNSGRTFSNRTLLEVGFSPYVNSPGSPASILEAKLGNILRHCDNDAIEKLLGLADAYPVPDPDEDERRRDLINSVRSLKTLAEERRKNEEDTCMLNDELKYLCRKKISELSFKRDWQGEKALRDFHNVNGQFKIRLPHRKIHPVTKGVPQPGSRVRRRRDAGDCPPPLVSAIEPRKPLAAHAADIERVVVQVRREKEDSAIEPHDGGLLTASEIIDITNDDQSVGEDRLPATAVYDSEVLSAACADLGSSVDCVSGNDTFMAAALYGEEVLSEMCDILNKDLENISSKKKQFGRVEFDKFGKHSERQWAPLLSSRSRPASGRLSTGKGRVSSKANRPHSAAPATTSALPSAFQVSKAQYPPSELLFSKGSQSTPLEGFGSLHRSQGKSSPVNESPIKVSKESFMQHGGNGVVYRDEFTSIRDVVEVHSPVKYWGASRKIP